MKTRQVSQRERKQKEEGDKGSQRDKGELGKKKRARIQNYVDERNEYSASKHIF